MKLEMPWHSTALHSANPTFILPLPAIPLPVSLFLPLWVVNKFEPEAPQNQTVNSMQLAKNIRHGANLMLSPFALTTLSSPQKY